jgi:hypothetical protein
MAYCLQLCSTVSFLAMPADDPETRLKLLEDRVAKLQRALYYLVWRRGGFGDHCIHCGSAYPKHEERCKAAEIEELVR